MTDFFDKRDHDLRLECNALKRELKHAHPLSRKGEITEKVLDLMCEKYCYTTPKISRDTIRCIWKDKNYRKRRKHKKEA